MPREKRKILTCYVTGLENEYIRKAANQAKISVSKYVRQVCLGNVPRSKVDQEAVMALLQVNQDLSRLGNLFKLAVDQETLDKIHAQEMINSINEMKQELMKKARAI